MQGRRMSFGIIWASLYHLAAREGQYTLDIYLIQIIVIEKLLGPFYKKLVSQSGINWVNEYGLIVKVVSTLVLSAILLGIVMGISHLCHKNQYVSKILF
jgi:fucose 4-O-acetylase-like acetyltransferase